MLISAGELPVAPQITDLYVALGEPGGARTAFALAREARRAGLQAQLELAGRSLKGQLRHADRIGAQDVKADAPRGRTRETWKWIALAALALVFLEWVFYHRRYFL